MVIATNKEQDYSKDNYLDSLNMVVARELYVK